MICIKSNIWKGLVQSNAYVIGGKLWESLIISDKALMTSRVAVNDLNANWWQFFIQLVSHLGEWGNFYTCIWEVNVFIFLWKVQTRNEVSSLDQIRQKFNRLNYEIILNVIILVQAKQFYV